MDFKKILFQLTGTLILLSSCISAQSIQGYLHKGDVYFEKWFFRDAIREYMKIVKEDPTHYETLWKTARAYMRLGETVDKNIQESYFQQARTYAEKAITVNPDGIQGRFWKAAVLGKLILITDGRTKIELSKETKDELETILKLDPEYGPAYYVLGRLQKGVAGLNRIMRTLATIMYGDLIQATNEEAVENFKKAIEFNPDIIEYRYQFARIYIRLKQWDLAREQLKVCLELPSKEGNDDNLKNEAQQLFNEIKNKK